LSPPAGSKTRRPSKPPPFDPRFADFKTSGLEVEVTTPPLPTPRKGPLVVDALGRGEFLTIGAALAEADVGARVLIRPGLYREGVELTKQVELVGDGPPEEIVVENNSGPVVVMRTENATVRGLTLRCTATGEPKHYAVETAQGRLALEDCDVSSTSEACVAVHGANVDPVIRRCRIHQGKADGIDFFDQARGVMEECDLFGQDAGTAIAVMKGADPRVVACKIHDNKSNGVFVREQGRGSFERCDLFRHAVPALVVVQGGDPKVVNCQAHDNQGSGVSVAEQGRGTFEGCHFYRNGEGAWDIGWCGVQRKNNRDDG
jgi:hypothetical protein